MTHYLRIGPLLRLARDTITDPREGASTVLSLAPPRQALWLMFALVVVLSLILGESMVLVTNLPSDGALTGPGAQSPMVLGLLQAAFLFLMIHAITFIGRLFGGNGRFEEAMILVIWLQFIFICVQVVQLAAYLVLPPLAGLVTIVALGLFFWLLVNFIAVLHGFTSLGMVFVMTIVSSFAILFVLSIVLTILGVTMPGIG